ncbi:MAG: Conserved TM helix repeat-containing protein [Candidatus Moranbacteria bacterium GW2011_GWC2_45_10]|nr:MAG: Conserved TM helix repeat-containing protein [Candidatus Moranbacteria bacterium GW2011_GWC2_45_10]
MNQIQTWGSAISESLASLGIRFASFLPTFIGAVLVFVIGLIVAKVLGNAVEKGIKLTRVDRAMEKSEVTKKFEEVGLELSLSKVFGEVVRWFLILVFLMAATDILQLTQVTNFLNSIIMYIPNVVVAIVVLAIAFILANFVYKFVRGSVRAAGVMSASLLASVSKWAIIVFGVLTALVQLGIAESIVNTLFIGFVAALSLAIGLSFGLGGKEEAGVLLRKIREEISEKK